MKRLYVGGLSHSITQKDLMDRFGKFGEVEDVELRTKTDEEGLPYKTFGYVNINISDTNLKKCLTTLNKSKWKGGILKIEPAKESFLHRLTVERQVEAERQLHPPSVDDTNNHLVESLSSVGVQNFTMKAAVPGTPVPGHADWVVSKFGRVLPVLQLGVRRGNRAQVVKYDPSKYCHNIRSLATPTDTPTPVTQLTWDVHGGDNDISKKRQGQFPPFEYSGLKKRQSGAVNTHHALGSARSHHTHHLTRGFKGPTSHRQTRALPDENSDSGDKDSDTELKDKQSLSERNSDRRKKMRKDEGQEEEEEEQEKALPERQGSTSSMKETLKEKNSMKGRVLAVVGPSSSEEEESTDSSSDSDYYGMFSNAARLEISLSDLQKITENAMQESKTTPSNIFSEGCRLKEGTTPEEILAAILEEDGSDDQQRKSKRRKGRSHMVKAFPAFQGTTALEETMEKQSEGTKKENTRPGEVMSKSMEEEEAHEEGVTTNQTLKSSTKASSSSFKFSVEEGDDIDDVKASHTDSSSVDEREEEPPQAMVEAEPSHQAMEEAEPSRQVVVVEAELQCRANLRRLAAVQQRQKEVEENRRLIQGALSSLDRPPAAASGRHIVFNSDDDEEDDEDCTSDVAPLEFKDDESKKKVKTSTPQLFENNENEEEDEDQDISRFDIRPQFEGRGGRKLLELQSRFGTDERFQMDSRFVEEDEAEAAESEQKTVLTEENQALDKEKKKSLSILNEVLINSQTYSKTSIKSSTFRDVSALHYDPSRTEHTAFETRTDLSNKDSKSMRRKRREEAHKLPQVSNEIFYNVSVNLKSLFNTTKEDGGEGEATSWDQEEEDQPPPSSVVLDQNQDESGFKFCFFGNDTEMQSKETEKYKVEIIQAPKTSWLQELCYHDSSSEEEEEEEDEEQIPTAVKTIDNKAPLNKNLFFFFSEDDRLSEGPSLFFCPYSLDESRENWEETRTELRQEYRKKHKDARRKLKSSQKN
ncbi:nucleolar protein 8 isoform X2 [Sphaeramia orbicularis]|uniref:nucleolar protein 8 isoform X2 n=1 Tax=Sphaeramia orbicularis TaxID=375764 RepID=UPI00117EC3DC|nr:nucleolar protein 8 isoform X2 [Sphaeramia orbicularis]